MSSFNLPEGNWTSSTLIKLNISVPSIDQCLYLLDEPFECLSALVVQVTAILDIFSKRKNRKKFPQLKCFSLSLEGVIYYYDVQVVLLHRKSDMEEQSVKDRPDEYITFGHLQKLCLSYTHTDYPIEFLANEYMNLPCLTRLAVTYEALATVTNNFTNDQA